MHNRKGTYVIRTRLRGRRAVVAGFAAALGVAGAAVAVFGPIGSASADETGGTLTINRLADCDAIRNSSQDAACGSRYDYLMVNRYERDAERRCMVLPGPRENGATIEDTGNIRPTVEGGCDESWTNQWWRPVGGTNAADGFMLRSGIVTSASADLCLTSADTHLVGLRNGNPFQQAKAVALGANENGTEIVLKPCETANSGQRWRVVRDADGELVFSLKGIGTDDNPESWKVLDWPVGSAEVQLWQYHGGDNQRWSNGWFGSLFPVPSTP
jgi:hypothetical protein